MPQVSRTTAPRRAAQAVRGGQNNHRPSAVDRIRQLDFTEDTAIQVLLYGQSGSGKTTLWGTFPQSILAMVCSGGMRPGELRSLWDPDNPPDIHEVPLHHSTDVNELTEHVAQTGKYKTVVLDHVSGLQDMLLKEIVGLEEIPVAKGWGMASREQYGQCTMQAKAYLRKILNLECNVVLIAHERTFGEEGDSASQIAPTVGAGLMPVLAGWLHGAVDYIGQTFKRSQVTRKDTLVNKGTKQQKTVTTHARTGRVEFCLRTGPDSVYVTKFRVPRRKAALIPPVIVDPTYDKILQVIQGTYEEPKT